MTLNRFISGKSFPGAHTSSSVSVNTQDTNEVNDDPVADRTPLLPPKLELQTYKRRWWILCVFSLASFMQSSLWNAWGPISYGAESALTWQDWNIAMIPNVSNLGFITTSLFMQYVIDRKGMRTSMVIATGCLFLNSGLWCIAVNAGGVQGYVIILLGAILNGISGSVYLGVPSLLSNMWFPHNQRATATALSSTAGYFGSAVSFLTGPFISGTTNITGITANISTDEADSLKHGILNLMYFDFGLCALSAALVIAYFPSQPSKPPSLSAQTDRMEFATGVKHILSSKDFWMINIAYNVPNGVYNSWLAVLAITLKPFGVSESDSGWIGFYSMIGGCLTAVVMARFTDVFKKKMKIFLLAMTLGALAVFVVLLLMVEGILAYTKALLYAVNIAGGCLINGTIPLYYELASETTYPAKEGAVGACLSIFNNLLGVMFYVIFLFPISGTQWTSWTLVGVLVVSVISLFAVKEQYQRVDMDLEQVPH